MVSVVSKIMGHQFHLDTSNPRFPISGGYASFPAGRDTIVDTPIEPVETEAEMVAHASERPRASVWLWRPWYAKLWWAGIAIYWLGKAGSIYSSILDQFYSSALGGLLNVAFFPPLALMVLGLGFARARFEWSDWEFVEPTHEQMFPKRSVGGMRDPYADPLDPRSGALHWRRVDGTP